MILARQDELLVSNVRIDTSLPTDHWAVLCTISIPSKNNAMKTVTAGKWRSIDNDQFKNDIVLSEIGSSNVQSMRDVKRIYRKYCEVLKTLVDKHAPARSKSLRTRAVAP